MKAIAGLLLAAGAAKRFGSDKLRHELPHGVAIAVQAARHLRGEVHDVFAVVPPDAIDLSSRLEKEGCVVVVCENAADGMGASLACAARAAGERAGYLIALADMPFIRRSSIAAVREALAAGAQLAAPYWRSRRGHPVGIAGKYFGDLLALRGDEGAKSLLAANEKLIVKVPLGDPGVIRDIDTPQDLLPPLQV